MADKKFFVDINLQGNKLANAVVGANSSMTSGGSFQYNAGRLEYYNGSSVEQVANLTDIQAVTGGMIFQGGYNASTNTPNLGTDSSILKGEFWVVTTAGTFLGEAVQVGDSLIAKQDNPGATLGNWIILQGNIVIATDSVEGISRLATQAEVDAGTEGGAVVVTPATLQGKINTATSDLESYADGVALTAENNAKSYADSLAPNYDPAGSATTAENNAKAYTDDLIGDATVDGTAGNTVKDRIDTAQANAESYADSLAPNYDPAGSASTAESNANTYTDTAVDALSFSETIATGDWSLSSGVYTKTITHNLGSYITFTAFYNGEVAEFKGAYANNTLTLTSNTQPSSNTIVNIVKAGGNI